MVKEKKDEQDKSTIVKEKKNIYFGQKVEQAVCQYLESKDPVEKNKLFEEKIYPALRKIAENLCNIFGVYRIENTNDVIDEVVTGLLLNMDKYNPKTGSKAFSYYTVAAKNHILQILKKSSAKRRFIENTQYQSNEIEQVALEEKTENIDFVKGLLLDLTGSVINNYWSNSSEVRVVQAVYGLLQENIIEKKDSISIYSRKGIYLSLRDITRLPNKSIARTLSKIRKRYVIFKEGYYRGLPPEPTQILLQFSGSSYNYIERKE